MHINSMDDSGDLEEAYERLGAVFHHDCYVDKKPEGRLFVCIAKNRSLQCNLGVSQVAISMLSSCVLLRRRLARLQSYSEPPCSPLGVEKSVETALELYSKYCEEGPVNGCL